MKLGNTLVKLINSNNNSARMFGKLSLNTVVGIRKLAGYGNKVKDEKEIKLNEEKEKLLNFLSSNDLSKKLDTVCISLPKFKLFVSKHYVYKRANGLELFLNSFISLYKILIDNPEYKIDPTKLENIIIRMIQGTSSIKKDDLIKDEICGIRQSVTESLLSRETIRNSGFTTGKKSFYGGKSKKKIIKKNKVKTKKIIKDKAKKVSKK